MAQKQSTWTVQLRAETGERFPIPAGETNIGRNFPVKWNNNQISRKAIIIKVDSITRQVWLKRICSSVACVRRDRFYEKPILLPDNEWFEVRHHDVFSIFLTKYWFGIEEGWDLAETNARPVWISRPKPPSPRRVKPKPASPPAAKAEKTSPTSSPIHIEDTSTFNDGLFLPDPAPAPKETRAPSPPPRAAAVAPAKNPPHPKRDPSLLIVESSEEEEEAKEEDDVLEFDPFAKPTESKSTTRKKPQPAVVEPAQKPKESNGAAASLFQAGNSRMKAAAAASSLSSVHQPKTKISSADTSNYDDAFEDYNAKVSGSKPKGPAVADTESDNDDESSAEKRKRTKQKATQSLFDQDAEANKVEPDSEPELKEPVMRDVPLPDLTGLTDEELHQRLHQWEKDNAKAEQEFLAAKKAYHEKLDEKLARSMQEEEERQRAEAATRAKERIDRNNDDNMVLAQPGRLGLKKASAATTAQGKKRKSPADNEKKPSNVKGSKKSKKGESSDTDVDDSVFAFAPANNKARKPLKNPGNVVTLNTIDTDSDS